VKTVCCNQDAVDHEGGSLSAPSHEFGHVLASLFIPATIAASCHSERSESHEFGHVLASLFIPATIAASCHSERSEESPLLRQPVVEKQIPSEAKDDTIGAVNR